MDRKTTEREPMPQDTVVDGCIDFRTIEKLRTLLRSEYALEDGDYNYLATAGAALNPETPKLIGSTTARVINNDHRDCGYAKSTGGDSQERHEKESEEFGAKLKAENPNLDYQTNIIPMEGPDLDRHHCKAVAIMLGTPVIVQQARERLDTDGLTNDHDEIARPYSLSENDPTVWSDFGISLKLHDPKTLYIFHDDKTAAEALAEKAQEEAKKLEKDIKVETVIIPKNS